MSYRVRLVRRVILAQLVVLIFGMVAHAQSSTDQAAEAALQAARREEALQAARTLVAANPLGTAPIQPAEVQAVIEATEEGGRAAAVIGLSSNYFRLALRMEAPLQSGTSETDFLTLDRLPGDAIVRGSIAYEFFRGALPQLDLICEDLNKQLLGKFRSSRALGNPVSTLPLLEHEPPDAKSSTTNPEVFAEYVRKIRMTLMPRPGWGFDLSDADRKTRRQLCEAESNRGPIQYVEPMVGEHLGLSELQEYLPGRSLRLCTLTAVSARAKAASVAAAATEDIVRRFPDAKFDEAALPRVRAELDKMPPDVTPEVQEKKAAELAEKFRKELRQSKSSELSRQLEPHALRAMDAYDAALLMNLQPHLLTLVHAHGKPGLSKEEQEDLVNAMLNAFMNTETPDAREVVLEHALKTYWPHKEEPSQPFTPGSGAPLPSAVGTGVSRALAEAESAAVSEFDRAMRPALAALPDPPPGWDDRSQSEALEAARRAIPSGPVAESVRREFLTKLIEPYSKLANAFNQLPKDLILAPSSDCSAKLVEARLAALPRSRERNLLFKTYAAALPPLMYFTLQGETGAKDFSWLAALPPTLNEENQIPTEKDTKYNSALSAGFTLFHRNRYWSLSYSFFRHEFTGQGAINVCATFQGSDSTLCRQGAPGPPEEKEPKVIEASVKHFLSPEFATHLQALYDRDTDTFNPHIFIYFFPQKDKGLRGGLDLSYLNHHPTQKDGFRARLFFGMPFKPPV